MYPKDTIAMDFFGVVSSSDATPIANASVGCVTMEYRNKPKSYRKFMTVTDGNGKYKLHFDKYWIGNPKTKEGHGLGHVRLSDGGDCFGIIVFKKGYKPDWKYLEQSPMDFVLSKD